jgi:hypothetical protein
MSNSLKLRGVIILDSAAQGRHELGRGIEKVLDDPVIQAGLTRQIQSLEVVERLGIEVSGGPVLTRLAI